MAKKEEVQVLLPEEVNPTLHENYAQEINTNPLYSLQPDPLGTYGLDDETKQFIKLYTEYESIPTVCEIMGIDIKKGRLYYFQRAVQNEISRIKNAMYHRQFANRLLNINEIGGYLTSLLMDNVPKAQQIGGKQKLQVVKMLIDINFKLDESMSKGDIEILDESEINKKLEKLNINELKQLISPNNETQIERDKKEEIIKAHTDIDKLSDNELKELLSLTLDELEKVFADE